MCCFSSRTEVHGTRIFARLTKPSTQVLAYQMHYAAAAPTAMILPLPVALPAREDSVRFKSLKEYPELFDQLELGFPELPSSSIGCSAKSKTLTASAAAGLEVHEVGDFVASFVPSVADFGRLDPRFVLSKEVWAKIPAYKDYGFAVFQLKELAGAPHPMALELDTRLESKLFFPTVHIHDGTVHERDEFDHALYLQNATFDQRASGYEGPRSVDKRTGLVRSNAAAKTFANVASSQGLLDPELLVHKVAMHGQLLNQDTFFDLRAAASGGCGRCDAGAGSIASSSLPVGLTLAGLAWIIRRRDALRARAR